MFQVLGPWQICLQYASTFSKKDLLKPKMIEIRNLNIQCFTDKYILYIPGTPMTSGQPLKTRLKFQLKQGSFGFPGIYILIYIYALGIQSPCQMMIGVYNHLLSKVFRFHYHSQKVIGSLGMYIVYIYMYTRLFFQAQLHLADLFP